jgi:glycine/D-amino acid oxidase-like deaminating enzyme
MIFDTIVIGSGLFGSLITHGLREIGRNVLLLGDKQPEAGSPPAACLMNPAWFKKLGKEVHEPALDWLYERFIVHNLPFQETTQSGKVKATKSWFIEPSEMLLEPDEECYVDRIQRADSPHWYVEGSWEGRCQQVFAHQVVVAAGVWTQELMRRRGHHVPVVAKAGVAFLYPEWCSPGYNFMDYWAPYKQIVGFQRGDGFWVNDGSAILRANWDRNTDMASFARCRKQLLGHKNMTDGPDCGVPGCKRLFGIRSYTEAKPCFLQELEPGLWVAVGAAKNGTLLGGHCARVIQERSK